MRKMRFDIIEEEKQPVSFPAPTPKDANWVPACGGTETPFKTRTGRTLLYCWNTANGDHAYLDCATDLILSHEEAAAAMGGF